jgi:small-conductance mechanosensitive channel
MIKWLTKQFIWGQIYHWAKDRLSGILFTAIILFLIIYFHNEYLKYIEFKEKNSGNYIGISFLIKNTLILIVTFSYFYFYKFLNKAKDLITKKEEQFELKSNNDIIKPTDNNEMVDNLDRFLEDDELNR